MDENGYTAEQMVRKWDDIDRVYYRRKPLSRKSAEWRWYQGLKEQSVPLPVYQFAELMQSGIPELISNFTLRPRYVLHKFDGTLEPHVLLRNQCGESKIISLPAKAVARRGRFRTWVFDRGNFCWFGTMRELHCLMRDVGYPLLADRQLAE